MWARLSHARAMSATSDRTYTPPPHSTSIANAGRTAPAAASSASAWTVTLGRGRGRVSRGRRAATREASTHLARRAVDGHTLAGELVELLPIPLECAVHGRNLQDVSAELRQGGLEHGRGHVVARHPLRHFAVVRRVQGSRLPPQQGPRTVTLGPCEVCLEGLAAGADADHEHAGGVRVERAAVAHLDLLLHLGHARLCVPPPHLCPERALYLRHHVLARPPGRLQDRHQPVRDRRRLRRCCGSGRLGPARRRRRAPRRPARRVAGRQERRGAMCAARRGAARQRAGCSAGPQAGRQHEGCGCHGSAGCERGRGGRHSGAGCVVDRGLPGTRRRRAVAARSDDTQAAHRRLGTLCPALVSHVAWLVRFCCT